MVGLDNMPRIIDFGSSTMNCTDHFEQSQDFAMLNDTLSRPPSQKKEKRKRSRSRDRSPEYKGRNRSPDRSPDNSAVRGSLFGL
jgi:hypothetical protein